MYGLNIALCKNFDNVASSFGLDMQDFNKYKACNCPIHGGDNPTGLTIYTNDEPYGSWQCNTKGCHRYFIRTAIGFVHGILSGKNGWTNSNKRKVPFDEVVNVCKGLVGDVDVTKMDFKTKILSDFRPKREAVVGVKQDIIRSRLNIPAQYFLREENGGFLAETLDFFDIGVSKNPQAKMGSRIIIPIYDEKNLYIGCQGRHPDPNIEKGYRWKNSDNLPLESILYNIGYAKSHIRKTKKIILVESPKSVWRLWEAGVKNVVAILGNFKSGQKILLETSGASTIQCMFDNDEAGENYYETIVSKCGRLFHIEKIQYGEPESDPANLSIQEVKNVFGI